MTNWASEWRYALGRFDFPPSIKSIKHVEDHPRPKKIPLPDLRFQLILLHKKVIGDIEKEAEDEEQHHFELVFMVRLQIVMF